VLSPNSLRMSVIELGEEGKDVLDVETSLGVSIEVLDLRSSVMIPRLGANNSRLQRR
jgi:hypothetical protein